MIGNIVNCAPDLVNREYGLVNREPDLVNVMKMSMHRNNPNFATFGTPYHFSAHILRNAYNSTLSKDDSCMGT